MEKKEHKMIDSPTLKYGSKDWECPKKTHILESVPKTDEDEIEYSCHDWRRYHADPDIDLSVIIAANGMIDREKTLLDGQEKSMIRSRIKK